jgi:hypothetical protein
MKVLIACERTGAVRDAFARLGHHAVSCDLVDTTTRGLHVKWDALLTAYFEDHWDLMIAHPTCTFLCSSGLHRNKRVPGREERTQESLEFVRRLMAAPIERIAIENPIGRIGTAIRKADQIIQPHQFGHDATKATCLWLKNLPKLTPTKHVPGRMVEWPKGSGKMVERWANQTDSGQNNLPPSDERWMLRSATYQGIADAMADQWGGPVGIFA